MTQKNIDREKRAAVRSTLLSNLLRLCITAALFWCWHQRQPGLIKSILLILAAANLMIFLFTFVALGQRLREIEKGELDEARKY